MDIGSKIKEIRLQRGFTQEALAARCELTKGYISQLENNVASPSIATLTDLLNVLGVNLQTFFTDNKREKVIWTKKDCFQSQYGDGMITWLIPNSQKNQMEPILLTLPINGESEARPPFEGEEFGYVIEGKIVIDVGEFKYQAKKGDAFYIRGEKEHKIVNISKGISKIIWVATPSSF